MLFPLAGYIVRAQVTLVPKIYPRSPTLFDSTNPFCTLCATRLLKVLEVSDVSEVSEVSEVSGVPEVMCWVPLCLLEVLEVMYCVLLRMLEGVESGLRSLEVREVMGCATLYARGVRGTAGAGGEALCTALYAGSCRGWALFAGGVGSDGGHTLCSP